MRRVSVLMSISVVAVLVAGGCGSDDASTTSVSTSVVAAPITGVPAATTSMLPTTTLPPTTLAPATLVPTTLGPSTSTTEVPGQVEIRQIGTSAGGLELRALRRGTPGGRVVLVIGVIHGDEPAGAQIVDQLEQLPVPDGVDLWLVPTMNPDGQSANDRHNANGVDLNRNFPYDWGELGVPGDSQYAGPSAASEPETQALMQLVTEIEPDLIVWYHQDLNRIAPGSGRDGAIRARYAELVGLPLVSITGGIYTGVAATWARHTIGPGVAFIVELGPSLTADEALVHANAVLTVAGEAN